MQVKNCQLHNFDCLLENIHAPRLWFNCFNFRLTFFLNFPALFLNIGNNLIKNFLNFYGSKQFFIPKKGSIFFPTKN